MILYHWQGAVRNFGDELNTVLWPRLLPGFFDSDPSVRFLGIGSVLDRRHPGNAVKLVGGSGYGGYEPPPRLDSSWIIHWVRGPRSAALLGLPAAVGLGDPAMLLPIAGLSAVAGGNELGFMPHFESLAFGAWPEVAAAAGVTLIDPRGDPLAIVAAIGRCRVLLSEAMHGVIVADALRVPWLAIEPLVAVHRAKWRDWAEAVGLEIAFRRLPASSMPERARASALASYHAGRRLLDRFGACLAPIAAASLIQRAADALRGAAEAPAQLSDDAALARCQARMMEALRRLRLAPLVQPDASRAGAARMHSRVDATPW
jgi:succinoglycan biosynthesis protein ExoV